MKTDNELIAQFMGLEMSDGPWEKGEYAYTMKHGNVFNKWVIPSHMRYHDSWDWLMPIVEKINRIDDELSGSITIDHSHVFLHRLIGNKHLPLLDWTWQSEDLIASVYKAVVDFVKWYNEQKK